MNKQINLLHENGHCKTLTELIMEIIVITIKHFNGNKHKAALHLGIGRSTLYRKLKGK